MPYLTNIRVKSPLPLHAYLKDNPGLCVRLLSDKEVRGSTPFVKGDLKSGIWEINSNLQLPGVDQTLTLAVVANKRDREKEFVAATLNVPGLIASVETDADGYREFSTSNYSIDFTVTCSVKLSSMPIADTSFSQPESHHGDAIDLPRKESNQDTGYGLGGSESALSSRAQLELIYATIGTREHADKARVLGLLVSAYSDLYDQTGRRADLEKALSVHEEAMQLTSSSYPQLAEHSHKLGVALQHRFGQSGDIADIERAVQLHQNALAVTGGGDPDKPSRLSNFGNALQERFECLGQLSDIQEAVSLQQQAVELTTEGHPDKPGRLSDLGVALRRRFERLGSLADIDSAISNLQKAVELTPEGHPDKPRRLNSLGNALLRRFERLGSLADINSAISGLQKAVELTPEGHPDKQTLLNNQGSALGTRFKQLGSLADIDSAILSQQKAVELTPEGHPDKPGRLNNLGNVLGIRFERLGSLADIDTAILILQKAVELAPEGHPDKPVRLNNLGDALLKRFERLDSLADIDTAILSQQKAVELTPEGHPDKPGRLSDLGVALRRRFERLGRLADIDSAILSQQKAVELTPEGHPDKPGRLNNLGNALETRFERLGSLADIDSAISSLQKAVELTPEGHPDKPMRLSNLGSALQTRFERLGSLADFDSAISSLQKAVELMPKGHPDNLRLLSNLGDALRSRFERLGSFADIDSAIVSQQKAVELTPEGHPGKRRLLNGLGNAFLTRFERLGSIADMDSAISSLQKAVELTPEGHPDKPGRLNNLGNALQARFERLGSLVDIDRAISNLQRAVELSPEGHPENSALFGNLGGAFMHHFEHFHAPKSLESALQNYSIAARSQTGPAMIRFNAARAWAKYSDKYSRSPLPAYSCAIELLPRIAWLGLGVADQHALLANVGDIVRDAVATAIQLAEYETAVEWAEQGRSIVWQNILGLRTGLDDLRAAHPQLARRLQTITRLLESPPFTGVGLDIRGAVPDITRKYSELATEWEGIIEEIRKIPEFEEFLKPKRFSNLAPAAHEGPVVILNVHDSRCDALLILTENKNVSTINIPLQGFSYEMSKNLFQNLARLLSSAGVRNRAARRHEWVNAPKDCKPMFETILRILWLHVAKPVIEHLKYEKRSDKLPHIWWCSTGFLSFLPIHAAGLYGAGETGESLSDYAVSSYTPTLTTILDMAEPIVQEDFQLLTVAQPATPNATRIPNTVDEVTLVQSIAGSLRTVNLTSEDATVERVLEEMKKSNWIHFACHGQQNVKDAMKSGFLLHDGTLELSNIVRTVLPKADFAFLSACQTATGDEKVAEESVHLAAGMLLSGCRGVIATMWSIRDDDGPQVAGQVYRRMLKDGRPNRKEAAYALHEAVKQLRESGAGFMAWVPFIHIGR